MRLLALIVFGFTMRVLCFLVNIIKNPSVPLRYVHLVSFDLLHDLTTNRCHSRDAIHYQFDIIVCKGLVYNDLCFL